MSARPLNLFLMSRSRVMTYSLRSNIRTKMHIRTGTHRNAHCHSRHALSIPVHRTGAGHTFDSICIGRFPMIGGDSWLMTSNRKCGILNHRWDSESFKLEQRLNYGIPVVAMRSGGTSALCGLEIRPKPKLPKSFSVFGDEGFRPMYRP